MNYIITKKAIIPALTGLMIIGMSIAANASSDFNLINVSTNKCLDSNEEGKVYTLECNGGNYQKWRSRNNSIVNVGTSKCLDSNAGGKVYTLECNGGNYQKWSWRGNNSLINVGTRKCLDSNEEGKVYTLECNGGNYQKWVR